MCHLKVLEQVGVKDEEGHMRVLAPGVVVDLHTSDDPASKEFDVVTGPNRGATFSLPSHDKRLARIELPTSGARSMGAHESI